MRCFFVYNPVSGRGKIAKKLDYIVRKLGEKYDTVDVYATQKTGDMERAAREAADKYDAIIFSGGDGSFNVHSENLIQGVAPGQFCVVYDEIHHKCIGSGEISPQNA